LATFRLKKAAINEEEIIITLFFLKKIAICFAKVVNIAENSDHNVDQEFFVQLFFSVLALRPVFNFNPKGQI
jgi:hypothetical protein